jgi:ribosomal protein L37AE/L43A
MSSEVIWRCDCCKKKVSFVEMLIDLRLFFIIPFWVLLNLDIFVCSKCKNRINKVINNEILKIRKEAKKNE